MYIHTLIKRDHYVKILKLFTVTINWNLKKIKQILGKFGIKENNNAKLFNFKFVFRILTLCY